MQSLRLDGGRGRQKGEELDKVETKPLGDSIRVLC